MAKTRKTATEDFSLLGTEQAGKHLVDTTHVYHGGARCATDTMGYATPGNRSPLDLVVDASQGVIPLWAPGVTLNWRFQDRALSRYRYPEFVARHVRQLMAEALMAWGPAVPVRFSETHQPWDFEIVVAAEDDCDPAGCTLARAFFPDSGQHELTVFPRMFAQSRQEQMETMAHELGHVFGLRHFFAKTRESAFPSEIFGAHEHFSIMNYGPDSFLTEADRDDLGLLYDEVWTKRMTDINGTPIRLVRPFSELNAPPVPEAIAALRDVARMAG